MLYSMFLTQAQQRPNTPAIAHGLRSITYGELNALILRTAKNLCALGVKPSETVAVRLESGIEGVALYYALARLGAQLAPLEAVPDQGLGHGVLLSNGVALASLDDVFNSDEHHDLELPSQTWDDVPFLTLPFLKQPSLTPTSIDDADLSPAATQTQGAHAQRVSRWIKAGELTPDDRTLCVPPLSSLLGADVLAVPALSTGQVLFLPDAANGSAERLLRLIEQNRITILGASPDTYRELVELPQSVEADLSSLRLALCASTAWAEQLGPRLHARYGLRLTACTLTAAGLVSATRTADAAPSTTKSPTCPPPTCPPGDESSTVHAAAPPSWSFAGAAPRA
jgi:acyl-CoA synthetase (AMP-forming)/AMP-acid ligase II